MHIVFYVPVCGSLAAPPSVPVVPLVAASVEVSSSQYVAQNESVAHQDSNVPVMPAQASGPVQGQNYRVWDSNQQSVSVQQQYSPAQSQATIYCQGQTCSAVYGVTSPHSQTAPPVVPLCPPLVKLDKNLHNKLKYTDIRNKI